MLLVAVGGCVDVGVWFSWLIWRWVFKGGSASSMVVVLVAAVAVVVVVGCRTNDKGCF